ncbi:UNVERIFIED_CONTAM: Kynurenine--oxoglutarate transaminase 3 [Sesamum radiatum]|uniref:Kynurenine--oxoglutarate transaminase 3 n=1 Tax=Sesamum radiatum TaxID=300843 RepID=A0AAW2W6V4_SESRA
MEAKLSSLARTLTPSSIQQLSYLAQRCNAVNLAEGFPDFPAPPTSKKPQFLLSVPTSISTVIDQGDEVILFDPSYETYDACIRLAGGIPVYVGLDPPQWTLNSDKLEKSFTEKTKALVLNSPHNPTGKVFNKDELEIIAETCQRRDVVAVTDEVYEHITFDNQSHISLASLPGMQSRTVITSSLSKTFSVTGWRIGWAVAPTCIASAVRNIHIRMTDCAPAPFQEAALAALKSPPAYFHHLRRDYESKRDCIFNLLAKVGFKMQFKAQGSFFVFAQLPESCPLSDVEFVEELIKQAGVVAVPGAGFFHSKPCADYASSRYIRFAFCKSEDTLAAASVKISRLVDASGNLKLF